MKRIALIALAALLGCVRVVTECDECSDRNLEQAVRQVQTDTILRALRCSNRDLARAASSLGIEPAALEALIVQLEITEDW